MKNDSEMMSDFDGRDRLENLGNVVGGRIETVQSRRRRQPLSVQEAIAPMAWSALRLFKIDVSERSLIVCEGEGHLQVGSRYSE